MPKKSVIQIRVDIQDKQRIAAAAQMEGKTISNFILDAAMGAVEKARPAGDTMPKGDRFRGVPSFFRAQCHTAKAGGEHGYRSAGYHLARHLDSLEPDDITAADWSHELAKLRDHIDGIQLDAAWHWFRRHYPKCMDLVPARRKDQFLQGVCQAVEEDRM